MTNEKEPDPPKVAEDEDIEKHADSEEDHELPDQPSHSGKDDKEASAYIHSTATEDGRPSLHHTLSHISTHDTPPVPGRDEFYEAGDEIYNKYTHPHKVAIVTILSFCAFLGPISSTSILAASPEVVATYNTTGTVFGISNALYLIFMGLSPLLYGPLGTTYGRKKPLVVAAVTFTGFSVGSALAPNLASYFIFRMLTAFQGTCFYICGAAVIADIYRPVERGTCYGYFLSGILIGPALGPLIGGVIVTYSSWRNIFWLQVALSGISSIGVILFIPETAHHMRSEELAGLPRKEKAKKLWSWINPLRVIKLFRYPNILIVGLASASLVWNMYSLLTPIRYVLNPRFNLTSPLQGALFYIAPGGGYLLGTFGGGRWADRCVRKWIRKRGGKRVPEDRLRSCIVAMGVVTPACMIVYGWSVEKRVGGIPLPVICMFLQGVAQLFCFPSINTYCTEVMQKRNSEVLAGNYVIRYVFAAAGTAACLPVIERIGVGWFSTISALFVFVASIGVWMTARYGAGWRENVERKLGEEK